MAGMCAAKAIEQFLCERLNYYSFLHVFPTGRRPYYHLYTILTQILHSIGFDAYVLASFKI